jgi:hypothetical protein
MNQLNTAKRSQIIAALVEGNSLRAYVAHDRRIKGDDSQAPS